MRARPISKICQRTDIVRSTFTGSPDTYYANAGLRSSRKSLRHRGAVFIAVHHGDVGADKSKGPPSDNESAPSRSHKRVQARPIIGRPLAKVKKRRAHSE